MIVTITLMTQTKSMTLLTVLYIMQMNIRGSWEKIRSPNNQMYFHTHLAEPNSWQLKLVEGWLYWQCSPHLEESILYHYNWRMQLTAPVQQTQQKRLLTQQKGNPKRVHQSHPKSIQLKWILKNPLQNLHVLDSPVGISKFAEQYKDVAVNNVNKDPRAFNTTKPSLVYGETRYNFDDYTVLNNISFLRKPYIRVLMSF